MFWQLTPRETEEPVELPPDALLGRFVLHRHRDPLGQHLDLRLEQDGCLLGWRIDGTSLDGAPWATEKAPHPLHWLEQDGDAVRVDSGSYGWIGRDSERGELLLCGEHGDIVLVVERVPGPAPEAIRRICEALSECGAEPGDAGRLVRDGATARTRAVERLCGLGREVDGPTFDESLCRKMLQGLSLDEIHAHLRTFEVRFDRKYPPQPVSKPESLSEDRMDAAMTILRS